jgi:hypothetical protein
MSLLIDQSRKQQGNIMKKQWMLGLFVIGSFSTVMGCSTGMVNDPDEADQVKAQSKRHAPPNPQPDPPIRCSVSDCVTGLQPDLAHGVVVFNVCGCTEVDFWNTLAQCNAQGGTLVDTGSCGPRTDTCDSTAFNCVIPPPTTPNIVASECVCDDTQLFPFISQCNDLGGEVTTLFPTGSPVTCTL